MMYILGIPNAAVVRDMKKLDGVAYVLLWPLFSLIALLVIAFRKAPM